MFADKYINWIDALPQEEQVINVFMELSAPVSYTHLDVYKRQEEYTFGNIVSMVELARANKIKVILTSVLPAAAFGWNPSVKAAPQKIMQLNACLLYTSRPTQVFAQ